MVHNIKDGSVPIYGIDNSAAVVVDNDKIASITVDDTHRVHVISPKDGLPYGTLDILA